MKRSPSRLSRWLFCASMLVTSLLALPAAAHPVGLSRGVYRPDAQGLALELTLAEPELAALRSRVEPDAAVALVERIAVSAAGQRCAGALIGSTRLERDGVRIEARYDCRAAGELLVEWNHLLAGLAPGHRHEARVGNADASPTLVFSAAPTLLVPLATTPVAASPSPGSALGELPGFVLMGIEHILMGFDHLVFVLALVMVGLGKRHTLLVVTAFTVAHSLTLGAAVTGLWSPPVSWVEPAIALSVAYVGLENLLALGQTRRALLAFAFGLIHGFGFAGALSQTDFRGEALWLRLASFNLGVEAGQLAVLALLLPLVAALRRHATVERYAAPAINLAVLALGVTWFGERIAAW